MMQSDVKGIVEVLLKLPQKCAWAIKWMYIDTEIERYTRTVEIGVPHSINCLLAKA